jgi:predicted nucleotidyltransferase
MLNMSKEDYKKEVRSLVKQIKQRYSPEKIILFGSAAKGKIHKTSDIDMLIIKKTRRRFIDRISDVLLCCDYSIPFEPLVYTPNEIKKCISAGDYFIQDILYQGKVLYG